MSNSRVLAKFLTAKTYDVKRDRHKYDTQWAFIVIPFFKTQLKKSINLF